MALIYIILAFIVGFAIAKFKKPSGISSATYSWIETIYPFTSAPFQIYRHLSPENKGAFWSVASSVVIGVLTAWLGFSVQNFVYNASQSESAKLSHYHVVDKLKPMYDEVRDSITTIVYNHFIEIHAIYGNDGAKKFCLKKIFDKELTTQDVLELLKDPESSVKKNRGVANLFSYLCNEKNWSNIMHAANRTAEVSASIAPYLSSSKREKLLINNGV